MKRFIILGALLFVLGGIGFMSGCSDDNNPTDSQIGDTSSVKFQYIDSTLREDMFDGFGDGIDLSLELLSEHLGISFTGSKDRPILSLQGDEGIIINSINSFEFTNEFWWVFSFDATIADGDDSTYLTGTDSVQILLGTTPLTLLEYVGGDPNFDAVKARAHVNGTSNDGGSIGAHHRMDVTVDEVGSDTVYNVSGTTRDTLEFYVSDGQGECEVFLSQWITIDDLEILVDDDLEDDCMQDGSISLTATIGLSCTGGGDNPGPLEQLDIEGTWTISAVINDNNTATFTFTYGTTTWRVTEAFECM